MLSKDDAIKGVPLFSGCSKKEIALVSRVADLFTVPAGHVLIREGSYGNEFFILLKGTAEVRKDGTAVATLGPGDFFGEIASVERIPRTATVSAVSPIEALILRGADLSGLRDQLPSVDRAVLDQIASRHSADEARH
jgi:CRP-like cAMP-binding protein